MMGFALFENHLLMHALPIALVTFVHDSQSGLPDKCENALVDKILDIHNACTTKMLVVH